MQWWYVKLLKCSFAPIKTHTNNNMHVQWVNGIKVVEHKGGHLPFQAELSQILNPYEKNRITVAVNNTLTVDTVPQGFVRVKEGEQ